MVSCPRLRDGRAVSYAGGARAATASPEPCMLRNLARADARLPASALDRYADELGSAARDTEYGLRARCGHSQLKSSVTGRTRSRRFSSFERPWTPDNGTPSLTRLSLVEDCPAAPASGRDGMFALSPTDSPQI